MSCISISKSIKMYVYIRVDISIMIICYASDVMRYDR